MIKGIAFDLEGTCIDVEIAHHQGHIRAAADVGITLTIRDCLQKLPHFIGGPSIEVAKEIAALSGGADPQYVLDRKNYHYEEVLKTLSIELRPGLWPILKWLKKNGFKLAIGSLTDIAHAMVLLEKTGLNEFIGLENIVLKEHVRHMKPEPDVWLETAKRMGINPSEQLCFEDSYRGIIAAKVAGSNAVGITAIKRPSLVIELLAAGAARVFMDWREINIEALISNLNEKEGGSC